jgi:hypothetical protein
MGQLTFNHQFKVDDFIKIYLDAIKELENKLEYYKAQIHIHEQRKNQVHPRSMFSS